MSTSWSDDALFDEMEPPAAIQVFDAPGFPPPTHAAEADLFARQQDVPAHDQAALAAARPLIVGGGGLGSWVAVALARSGIRFVTLIDHDRFDRTNAPRQLMFGADLGESKAIACAKNIVDHMVAGGRIAALPTRFEDAEREMVLPGNIALFLVDNNACRFAGIRFARARQIPAVFAMLSRDGMRIHVFLQGPGDDDACLHCALPNLDPEADAPCAAATIASCWLAVSYAVFFSHRALMGWPPGIEPFNWREADLLGIAPDRVGRVARRADCPTCSNKTC